jgi:ABC-type Zn uptake system ZnuABC Zn-binding protein ZnuA
MRGLPGPIVVSALASLIAAPVVAPTADAQTLRVVATTSDLASLARSVAGELAQVDTVIPPGADPEAFEPRPSDLAKLKGAQVIVRVGLGYDHWLDKLLAMHGDAAVNRGGAGYVDASVGIPLLEVKGRSLDPVAKDGHAHGIANPHYWLDPANAEVITGAIVEAMIRVDASTTEKAIANRDRLLGELTARRAGWEGLLRPHRGAPLVAYHNTWPYFARHFRLDIVDVIESKEGVSPSPARLAKLAGVIRDGRVRVILHEPFAPEEAAQLLARRTGASVLKLAPSVGTLPEAADYISLFDYDTRALSRALSSTD